MAHFYTDWIFICVIISAWFSCKACTCGFNLSGHSDRQMLALRRQNFTLPILDFWWRLVKRQNNKRKQLIHVHCGEKPETKRNPRQWLRILAYTTSSMKSKPFVYKRQDKENSPQCLRVSKCKKVTKREGTPGGRLFAVPLVPSLGWQEGFSSKRRFLHTAFRLKWGSLLWVFCFLIAFSSKSLLCQRGMYWD